MKQTEGLIERFLRYVKIDTQSSENTGCHPSTEKQHNLAKLLYEELLEMGAEDVYYDREHCYVYASVSGDSELDSIGFIAHMDTSPAASGANVQPRIIKNYDGNDEFLKPEEFPELRNHIGENLIASDGSTLLGADDKAGIAEIMNLVQYLLNMPEETEGERQTKKGHRPVRVAFTPDEEIGEGTDFFDFQRFNAPEAYTVDGGKLGVIEYENFNAAAAKVTVKGRSVHPGDAKNIMKNAAALAMEFHSMLPSAEVPEHTEGYEGFYYLDHMEGDTEEATLDYIIRDHDREIFEQRKDRMEKITAYLNEKYGAGSFLLELRDQYYNMKEIMKDHMHLIEDAAKAMEILGVTPVTEPIRGGTDGAILSFKGLPCPNLCTGGYNYHGRYEYASINEMETCAELLINIVM